MEVRMGDLKIDDEFKDSRGHQFKVTEIRCEERIIKATCTKGGLYYLEGGLYSFGFEETVTKL